MAVRLKDVQLRRAVYAAVVVFLTQVTVVKSEQSEQPKPETLSVVINKNSLTNQDHIQVLNSPPVIDNSLTLSIEYRCSHATTAGVEILADTDRKLSQKLYRRLWRCPGGKDSNVYRKDWRVRMPDKYAYLPDRFNPHVRVLSNVRIRAWVTDYPLKIHSKSVRQNLYNKAFVKVSYNTNILSPYMRPKNDERCLSWSATILAKLDWARIGVCPQENEVIEAVRYPVALSGTYHGIVKRFPKFSDENLEWQRTKLQPEFTISMWLYVLDYCPFASLCSVMHHFSKDDFFLSPLICFTPEGKLHIQIVLKSGFSKAVLTPFSIPKQQWLHLVFSFRKTQWTLDVEYGPGFNTTLHTYLNIEEDVVYDDSVELFSFGGSEMMPSFKGYIGQAVYYRNKAYHAREIAHPSPYHPMFQLGITARDDRCHTYIGKIHHHIYLCQLLKKAKYMEASCPDFFEAIKIAIETRGNTKQCPVWSSPPSTQYGIVNRLVKERILNGKPVHKKDIGKAIYKKVIAKIDKSVEKVPSIIRLLKQAACYENYDAMYMLSVIFNNGFLIKSDEIQSHAFLMKASLEQHRLSTMSLANKHNLGLDGIPLDREQAYMYYKYVAEQAREDRERHKDTDIMTEHIRLSDEFQMSEQTDEDGDLFVWMKLQAQQGVLRAQQYVARSLFWGSQGLGRNVRAALEYFRLGAEQEDPVAMYDYGIVLIRGQGTEKNVTKGLELVEKSAAQGNDNALSALGWHALEIEKNYTKAAEYLEKAYRLGNPDAGHNLGHMYLTGKYPNKTVDKHKAFEYFQWAAVRHQFDAGVMVSQFFMKGTDRLTPNVLLAVEWARFIAEKNPHIGRVLRKALKSYRQGNIPLSLFYYMLAADTGLEVANFNLGLLCEENKEGIVTYVEKECHWNRFNMSVQREEHHIDPYSLIKMGDFHWYGCEGNKDIDRAVEFYTRAALKGDPHAIFNLAFMVEEGVELNKRVLYRLRVPQHAMTNNFTLLTELYTRCKESRKTEAFLPCSLALWRIQLLDMWTRYRTWMTLSSAVGATVVTTATIISLYQYFKGLRNQGEVTQDTV